MSGIAERVKSALPAVSVVVAPFAAWGFCRWQGSLSVIRDRAKGIDEFTLSLEIGEADSWRNEYSQPLWPTFGAHPVMYFSMTYGDGSPCADLSPQLVPNMPSAEQMQFLVQYLDEAGAISHEYIQQIVDSIGASFEDDG
jgi:hypothetical protein